MPGEGPVVHARRRRRSRPAGPARGSGSANENISVTGSRASSLISSHVSLEQDRHLLLHRVAGEAQEDVLERGLLDAQVGRRDAVGDERGGRRARARGRRRAPRRAGRAAAPCRRAAPPPASRRPSASVENTTVHVLGVLGDQLGRRALGDDASRVHHGDAVAEPLRLLHEVRDEDDRRAHVAHSSHQVPGHAARGRVEPGGHLVEKDELRIVDQRQGDEQALALPAGEPVKGGLALVREAPLLHDLPPVVPAGGDRGEQVERLPHAHVVGQRRLLQLGADAAAQLARLGRADRGRARAPRRRRPCAGPAGTRRSSSCRRRWSRAGRRSRPRSTSKIASATATKSL